jgi:hypothetical protein
MNRASHLGLAAIVVVCLVPMSRADDKVQFNRDVRPILADTCFKCHGPAARKGGIQLDVREEATKPGRGKRVPIVPGQPEKSEVVRRVFATDDDTIMPPPSAHRTLTAAQKETIKRWISEGAVYQKHWSFEMPVKPAIPMVGAANPIDAFLVDRLKREKLTPGREADRTILIRRVAFALTGLPPTPSEVDAFLADRSGDAYEKMVDRYLASPRFGEEMARHWLDVARYADTHGLHLDNERQMWLYRDWVVKAFNANMPFDRFTTEQIAGDLVPGATREQMIGTGFLRCNVTTSEGGSIDSEWVFRNAVDRATTTTEVFLGLTAGCAVCHDHKFDPIRQKEYYSLYAFFHSAAGPALDGNKLLTEPVIKMTTAATDKRLGDLAGQITQVKQELAKGVKAVKYTDPADATPPDAKTAADPAKSYHAWIKQGGRGAAKHPDDITKLLKRAANKLDAASEKRLRDYYLEVVCTETKAAFAAMTQRLDKLTKERDTLDKSVPGSFVFEEMKQPRESFVMMRGAYDKPGDKVEPNTPAFLPPLKKAGARANRLDLARWLLSPEQPLTSRVTVNRFWQQFFGVGLVKSSSDFGVQGELPSHPELLDWLAIHYRETGWDTKALVKLIVTSDAFRRDARVAPELLRRDPENRLLARGPRMRLDAEQIRDNALFVSGLINLEMGGKGVKPYQPPKIWEPVAFTGSNTMNYVQDKGAALYRRSIYTFFKRTAPPPSMTNFDAPNRESSCSRRERSNTPLQALQLMNDVQHFEAARAFAERIITEGGKTPAERIAFAYKSVLSRVPTAAEATVVQQALDGFLSRYRNDVDAARQVIRAGESTPRPGLAEPEVAAYTLIANLILNLDETVTRN